MNAAELLSIVTSDKDDFMTKYVSLFSQLYHSLSYSIQRSDERYSSGMLIISVDVDVGNKELGTINKGKNDANVNRNTSEYKIGEIEEFALPMFVEIFNSFRIPASFAIRGQLTAVNGSVLRLLRGSSVKHDIGAHGYSHRKFTELSWEEAECELSMISRGMKEFGITPRTFVFPANCIAYLDLLEKYGYSCYRGYGNFIADTMCIEKQGELYNIHPSLYVDKYTKPIFLRKILDISAAAKLPFHLWFHLWNFGEGKDIQRSIEDIFLPLLDYAKKKEENGLLTFETMLSAAERVEKHQEYRSMLVQENSV